MKTLLLFGVPLVLFNLSPLRGGAAQVGWMWTEGGDLLRFFTHPWVHTSVYHLLLDASAFLSLWVMLRAGGSEKTLLWLGANLGSVAGARLSGLQQVAGFCGLSGIAHGVLAYLALEWMGGSQDPVLRRAGAWTLALVLAKTLFEGISGGVLFASLHVGDVGTPLTGCHFGGVAGAMLAYGIWHIPFKINTLRYVYFPSGR